MIAAARPPGVPGRCTNDEHAAISDLSLGEFVEVVLSPRYWPDWELAAGECPVCRTGTVNRPTTPEAARAAGLPFEQTEICDCCRVQVKVRDGVAEPHRCIKELTLAR